MKRKTDTYVFRPREVEPIPYHDMEKAKKVAKSAYNYLDASLIPGADMVIHIAEFRQLTTPLDPYVEPHKHEVSSFYGVIGDLTIEVILEGERHEVTGPGSVFIPPGMMHSVRALRGDGHVVIVLRTGTYH